MRVLQILDHVGIYLVIVGTMTPFMLVGLHHHSSARVLICAEWIAAFLGCLFAGKTAVGVVSLCSERGVSLVGVVLSVVDVVRVVWCVRSGGSVIIVGIACA
jgi:channel protein (hemolysin III family)